MRWPKGTTCWPAYAGTSEMLSGTPPKVVQRQRTSLTRSTTSWSFCTIEAMENFLADRKAMVQHQETMPRTRTYLWMRGNLNKEMFEVWEVVDAVPPSTALETEPELNVDPSSGQAYLPCLVAPETVVRSESADGSDEEKDEWAEPF